MRNLFLPLITLIVIGTSAQAGRNADGAMVVHTDDTIEYSAGAQFCESPPLPTECVGLNTNAHQGIEREQVIWLLAAFPDASSPGVTTIQFGITHNIPPNQGYFTQQTACGPMPLELPDTGWPETGFGNLVAYGVPVYEHLFRFYWFALFVDGPDNYFGTRTYPSTNEAKFVDDGSPPIEDLCTLFGTVRWDGNGTNSCPGGDLSGACCFIDGHCEMLPPGDCFAQGGTFTASGYPCEPNPCAPTGSCCFCDTHCEVITAEECYERGGEYWNLQATCDPNPCPAQIGVCCLDSGECVEVRCIRECANLGGHFDGYGGGCIPNPCAQPQVACCFDDGTCQYITADQCEADGGHSQGEGSDCEPNLCPYTPSMQTTWGKIKASYR
jgi:hypothetical protein